MNAKSAAPSGAQPALIIDAGLYPQLLALAERARERMPDLGERLLEEIERADLRSADAMPPDVVTIGSEVTFRDGDRTQTVRVVLPHDADIASGRVSVVTPVGAALIGLTKGQRIEWRMPGGHLREIEVLDVRQ
jgi:regulator of nucleoside diphosphate kinase